MSVLRIFPDGEQSESYAVFLHGLGSNIDATWSQPGHPGQLWPRWLVEDVPGAGVGFLQYETPRSNWQGQAMHVTDRALNLLTLLLSNTALSTGSLILVGHSLGGLMIKQMLRTADSMRFKDPRAGELLSRLRGVVFYASPHSGSHLASWANRFRFLVRPSAATSGLIFGDPNLRDLNQWFREFADRENLKILTFNEMHPMRLLGMVVTQESADAGFDRPIPIDADHVNITQVTSRSDLQYSELLNFIKTRRQLPSQVSLTSLISSGDETARPQGLTGDPLMEVPKVVPSAQLDAAFPRHQVVNSAILDAQLQASVTDLRRRRFYCDTHDQALALAVQVSAGGFAQAATEVRAQALGWAARILRTKEHLEIGRAYLREAQSLAATSDIDIVAALYEVSTHGLDSALASLSAIDAPEARTAAFMAVKHEHDSERALEWLDASGLALAQLDADGRFAVVSSLIDVGRYDDAVLRARECSDVDRDEVPALNFLCGLGEIFSVVANDFRPVVAVQVPFEANDFPLASDVAAIEARRRAIRYFEASEKSAREVGCERSAKGAEITALWLKLRDPGKHASAFSELRQKLRDQPSDLSYVTLALQFHLKLDLKAVEAEIDRQTAFTGGGNIQVALARFAFVFTQRSPAEVIQYLERHKAQLEKFISIKPLRVIEMEMRARSGQTSEARALLSEVGDLLDAGERARIQRMLEEAQGQDPLQLREQNYGESGQLTDLINLVNFLNETNNFEKLSRYSEEYFEKTKSVLAAEIFARSLNNSSQTDRLGDFLRSSPDIVEQSRDLRLLAAWAKYRDGDFDGAKTIVDALRSSADGQQARDLYVNLAISSGEWTELISYLEGEWAKRDAREPSELLRAAGLARLTNSPRERDFAEAAVLRAPEDAEVLIGAYGVASASGWEDQQAGEWLRKAIELSSEDGPIQRMSIKDLIDQQPEWDEHQSDLSEGVAAGTLPMFLAAKGVRRSLLDLFLRSALNNLAQPDPRKWSTVPAFSGGRSHDAISGETIALDITTLLTLSLTGLLTPVLNALPSTRLAHGTLAWLFEEKQQAAFHQPSRIKDARELRDLLATKAVEAFVSTVTSDAVLAGQVGEELAALLAEARSPDPSGRPKFVVRPYPVHLVGSLMEEQADLSAFGDVFVSCTDVVNKLHERGQITSQEQAAAVAHLATQEESWPTAPEIPDGAILYLEDVSVSYLRHVGVLGKLRDAGFRAVISPREIEEGDALLQYEQIAAQVLHHIENVRAAAVAAKKAGRLRFEKMPRRSEEEEGLARLPTAQLLTTAADAVAIDDRALNRHARISDGGAPIASSLSVLEALASNGTLSRNEIWAARTTLRLGGFAFVSVDEGELIYYLDKARVTDGKVVESAELRAIRTSMSKIRMGTYLRLPQDGEWLQRNLQTFRDAILKIWQLDIDLSGRRAISNWLFEASDMSAWLHTSPASQSPNLIAQLIGDQIVMLVMQQGKMESDRAAEYRLWMDEEIIAHISVEMPGLLPEIDERLKGFMEDLVERVEE